MNDAMFQIIKHGISRHAYCVQKRQPPTFRSKFGCLHRAIDSHVKVGYTANAMNLITVCFLLIIASSSRSIAASNAENNGREPQTASPTFEAMPSNDSFQHLLTTLENAIARGDVDQVSSYFASRVFLNFFTGDVGYFSSNQAFYVLKKFFTHYRPLSFSFSSSSKSESAPYALGQYSYSERGVRGSAQFYISFMLKGGSYSISQITISRRQS